MNYIEQLNNFNEWLEYNYLSPQAQLLYFKLLHLFNKAFWKEWMVIDNNRLMGLTQIKDRRSLKKYRDELIENNLIEFEVGKKAHPSKYKLVPLLRTNQNQVVPKTLLEKAKQDNVTDFEHNDVTNSIHDSSTSYVQNNDPYLDSVTNCVHNSSTSNVQNMSHIINNKHKTKTLEKDIPNGISKKTHTPKSKKQVTKPKANHGEIVTDIANKHVYGSFENVWLKDSEVNTLMTKHPDCYQEIIETLSNYKAAKGRGYRSDYAAMNNWVIKRVTQENVQNQTYGRSVPKNKTHHFTPVSDDRMSAIESFEADILSNFQQKLSQGG